MAFCKDIRSWLGVLATLVEGVARGIFEQPLHLACGSCASSLLPTLLVVAMFGPGWVHVLHWSRAELRLQLTCCSRLLFLLATCLGRLKDPDNAILLRTCLRLSPRPAEGSKQRQFVTVLFAVFGVRHGQLKDSNSASLLRSCLRLRLRLLLLGCVRS